MNNYAVEMYPGVMLFIYSDREQKRQAVLTTISEQLWADIHAGKPLDLNEILTPPELPGAEAERLCVNLDESLYRRASAWCADKGITLEQVVESLVHFWAKKENRAIATEMLNAWKLEVASGTGDGS